MNSSSYFVDSEEAHWNTNRKEEGGNLGFKVGVKGGYVPVAPVDTRRYPRRNVSFA